MAKNQEKPQETQEQAKPEQPSQIEHSEKQELVDQLQRVQAEFENYRKRGDNQAQLAAERGQEQVIKELLPIIDSFELALKHYGKAHEAKENELLKGMELIYSQFLSQLERLGIQRIPEQGSIDPRLHEVYLTEDNGNPDNSIIETLQHGYVRNGVVLRTAKVKAARKA